jgi:dihydrofolate reductase
MAASEHEGYGVAMRKLLSFHVISVDGYYEGAGQAFDWPVVDEEFNQFSVQQLEEADTLVFGRVTYQLVLVLDGHDVTVPGVVTESADQPGPRRHRQDAVRRRRRTGADEAAQKPDLRQRRTGGPLPPAG